ncbi:hypothetical protein OsJ_17471 [Oryza sativa Japonica Group]|uniref:Uncharacterized protein n=1 Tax=Oryza sativa subsp. japonica TaxID=39947 RepID=B9FIK9_ORYSJ|nr:hypothetical protein OsJ_17471 [Oryza sativa Japonica Group]
MGLGSGGGLGLGGSTTRVYGTGGSAVGRPRTAEAMASSSRNDHASGGLHATVVTMEEGIRCLRPWERRIRRRCSYDTYPIVIFTDN